MLFVLIMALLFSCKSEPEIQVAEPLTQEQPSQGDSPLEASEKDVVEDATEGVEATGGADGAKGTTERTIKLLFAGDVMAHKPNYEAGGFDGIWDDIKDVVKAADLSFANIEAPVADSIGWRTYPQFNMKRAYPDSAISAGFNCFSLSNNHTNDQGLEGIKQTAKYFGGLTGVYSSGLREQSGGECSYCVIEVNGVKVLFLAVTALLNSPQAASWINYVRDKSAFLTYLKKLKSEVECDLFVLSYHSDEAEYIKAVSDKTRAYYKEILDCGVDILWANHPHVVRQWEMLFSDAKSNDAKEESGNVRKLIMYGMGNTISAQRVAPDFKNPKNPRDDTGDGVMLFMSVNVSLDNEIVIKDITPTYITTYIDENKHFVIKKLDDQNIAHLPPPWGEYLKARKEITQGGLTP